MDVKQYLGKFVDVTIDRPIGSLHPKYHFSYEVNYGFIPDTLSPDGEEMDAYVLGIAAPMDKFSGKCIAVVHRITDNDDKLIVAPEGLRFTDEKIEKLIGFQEKWFQHRIIR